MPGYTFIVCGDGGIAIGGLKAKGPPIWSRETSAMPPSGTFCGMRKLLWSVRCAGNPLGISKKFESGICCGVKGHWDWGFYEAPKMLERLIFCDCNDIFMAACCL